MQPFLPSIAGICALICSCAIVMGLGSAPLACFVVHASGVSILNHGTTDHDMKTLYVICHAGEKRPIGFDWANCTIDDTQLAKRLATNPTLNVGILLGPDTDLIDVECDSETATNQYRELFGDVVTPSWRSTRGCHYLYRYDSRLAVLPGAVKLASGLEFRLGNGKQIQSIIPPSVVDGVKREWIVPMGEPAELPVHVIQLLLEQPQAATETEYDELMSAIDAGRRESMATKLRDYCDRHGLKITREHIDQRDRRFLHLARCPFKPAVHDDGDPCIMVTTAGSAKWSCRHAKCKDKTWDDVESIYGSLHPIIDINHELHRMVDEAGDALATSPNVYQYGQALVSIVHDAKKPKQCLHDNGSPQLVPLPKPMLATRLSACAEWRKFDARKKDWKRSTPPENVVNAVHVSNDWPRVPVITGIVSSPVLRADGTILSTAGYDKATGLYLDSDCTFPPLMNTGEALAQFAEVLHDFPFATPAHRNGWIASLITILARPAFAGNSPFFLVDANASRVGKGLLTDVLTMIVEGRRACRYSWSKDNEETRKLISTVGMSGSPYLLFDNIKGTLGGPALEKAMTTAVWGDRLLSLNRQVQFPINFAWIGTGNNCALTVDMLGRTQHIRLNTNLENPAERSGFRHNDLLAYVKANRHKLAMAALSIPAGFVRAGRPDQKLVPWGGFEAWSDLVRGSIVWAGLADPGNARAALAEQADDDTSLIRLLIDGWQELPVPMTVAQALETIAVSPCDEYVSLRAAVTELKGDPQKTIGYLLRDARGRIVGGKRFDRTDSRPSKWMVVEA